MVEVPGRLMLSGLCAWGGGLDIAWEPFHEGVEIHRLYGGRKDSASAALLRYAPGARTPAHVHTGYEHILVLEGSQQDQHGHYPVGTLTINAPGSSHAVFSEHGCIVLAIWERPVDMQL